MSYQTEKPMPAGRAILTATLLALVLPGQSNLAGATTPPGADQSAPVEQTQAPVGAPPEEAAGGSKLETAAGTESLIKPTGKTVEQVRVGMEDANKRRQSLLQPDAAVVDSAIHKALIERWGVEVIGVREAARGYMIDFRFRVLDADKALPLFDSRIQPYLLTEGTNVKLPVPVGEKVGAFRTTNRGKNIQAGKDYYMMFANPDSYVRPGQRVSVVIGDFRAEHMTLR